MSFEWPKITFEQAPFVIIDGDRGVNYPKQQDFLAKGYCLFLNTGNVTTSGFNFSNCAFITKEKDDALRKGKLMRGDIVLTTRGTVGNVGFFSTNILFENIRINSGMVVIRPDPTKLVPYFMYLFLRSEFIYYNLSLRKNEIKGLAGGSAQPILNKSTFSDLWIECPSLDIQKEIVRVFNPLDNRISLLRETNTTLEAIAQTLFKSWFVDFDPVKAKAESCLPEGMDEATAALFPSEFEESVLGLIPKGWSVRNINQVCDLGRGSSPRPIQQYMGNDVPWIKIADATASDGMFVFETKEKIIKEGVKNSMPVKHGDLIMSNSASCGITVFVELEGCIHDGW